MDLNVKPHDTIENDGVSIIKSGFYALFLYIPTLFFAGSELLLFYPIALLILEHRFLLAKFRSFRLEPFSRAHIGYVWFPLAIIVSSSLNKLFNGAQINGLSDLYAPFLLLPLLIVGGHFIQNQKIARFFIMLVVLEVLVCIFEYVFGVRSFFVSSEEGIIIQSKALLYDSRVYGLSVNSSVVGLKLFCAFLFLGLANFSKRIFIAVSFLLFIGVLITFNRAVILALLLFLFLILVQYLIKYRFNWQALIRSSFFNLSLIVFVSLFFYKNEFSYQFSRGDSVEIDATINKPVEIAEETLPEEAVIPEGTPIDKGIAIEIESTVDNDSVVESESTIENSSPQSQELSGQNLEVVAGEELILKKERRPKSIQFKETYEITDGGFFTSLFLGKTSELNASGRDLIWANYTHFIEHNWWFGNGSDKLMLVQMNPNTETADLIHAHNSYLMMLASNGLVISILWFSWLLFIWKKKNTVLIVSVLVYSLFQYGVFWGFSLLDVIFVSLIMSPVNYIPVEYKKSIKRN